MVTAVDPSAVARTVGIETTFRDLGGGVAARLPQRIALVGQGNTAAVYSTDKRQVTSASEVGSTYGFGSPLHLAALHLIPPTGDGIGSVPLTVYPLAEAGGAVAATGDATPSGSATRTLSFRFVSAGIRSEAFTVETGDSVAVMVTAATAAINATTNFPLTATDSATTVDLTAKWAGASGNDITIDIEGPTDGGVTWAFTQPAGGATNPDVTPALDQVGEVWETMFVNCLEAADATALDAYFDFGEGRWAPLIKKPMMVFTGSAEDLATVIAITDARKSDRTNSLIPAPGSANLPLQIAARAVARTASQANRNPPVDYARLALTGLVAGTDGEQWTYAQRDQAVKAGASTTRVASGVIQLSDTVTMFHPDGEPTPGYRYVVDVVKLQNIIFGLNTIFDSPEWDGAPLIPDDQPTSNRDARQPKAARTAIAALVDSLADDAIISDPAFSKETLIVEIDDANPKRLNVRLTVKLSGNVNIVSINLDFGFFFGG